MIAASNWTKQSALVAVLKQAGQDVDYVRLAGEGHAIFHWRNQVSPFAEALTYRPWGRTAGDNG
jgi:dipeptidyl aminopeptidase/acylaminoacyl peptidase